MSDDQSKSETTQMTPEVFLRGEFVDFTNMKQVAEALAMSIASSVDWKDDELLHGVVERAAVRICSGFSDAIELIQEWHGDQDAHI